MKSLTKRLITAFVAIPFLLLIIILLPYQNYLAFFFIILLADIAGTIEMKSNILEKNGDVPFSGYFGVVLPLVQYIQIAYLPNNRNLIFYILAIAIGLVFAIELFQGAKDNFSDSIGRIGRAILSIIYPSFFAVFLVRLCFLDKASWFIVYFLALVFGTDTFAYFFGMAFGRNNKGFVKVSPNKSIAGYAGGIIVPAIIGIFTPMIFKSVFTYTPFQGFIIGLITAIAACIGDLIESCFKRSAGIKDSGIIIPGRGGMLDSIDSILIAAPFYFFLTECFLGFIVYD